MHNFNHKFMFDIYEKKRYNSNNVTDAGGFAL